MAVELAEEGIRVNSVAPTFVLTLGYSAATTNGGPLMRWRMRGRQIFLFVVFGVLVGMWGWLYARQQNGDFIAHTIQVQFGDETYGELQYAYFSGTYELASDERVGRRPVYYERGETSNRSSGKFFYCTAEEAWVFTIADVSTEARNHGISETQINEWKETLPGELVDAVNRGEFNGYILSRGLLRPDHWVACHYAEDYL